MGTKNVPSSQIHSHPQHSPVTEEGEAGKSLLYNSGWQHPATVCPPRSRVPRAVGHFLLSTDASTRHWSNDLAEAPFLASDWPAQRRNSKKLVKYPRVKRRTRWIKQQFDPFRRTFSVFFLMLFGEDLFDAERQNSSIIIIEFMIVLGDVGGGRGW